MFAEYEHKVLCYMLPCAVQVSTEGVMGGAEGTRVATIAAAALDACRGSPHAAPRLGSGCLVLGSAGALSAFDCLDVVSALFIVCSQLLHPVHTRDCRSYTKYCAAVRIVPDLNPQQQCL